MWRDALAATDGLRHEIQELLAEGDVEMARVVVTGTLIGDLGTVARTGRAFRIDQAIVCHLREGRIAEAWEIANLPVPDPKD